MSLPRKRIDWKQYDVHKAANGTDAAFAKSLGIDPRNFPQYKKTRHMDEPTIIDMPVETIALSPTVNSTEDTAPHSADDSAELPSIPDNRDIQQTTVQGYALSSAETLADHETRLQMLEGFMAALQAQARQPAVQHITVQNRADSAYALHSAESVQTWDNPEDAKPERWNLWLPRGLKRRIEAQAKAAGIAPSSLVQRLLLAVVNGQEVHRE